MHCANAGCKRGALQCKPEVVSWCRATRGLECQAEGLGLYPGIRRRDGVSTGDQTYPTRSMWGMAGKENLGTRQLGGERVHMEEMRHEPGCGDGEAGAGQRGWAGRWGWEGMEGKE